MTAAQTVHPTGETQRQLPNGQNRAPPPANMTSAQTTQTAGQKQGQLPNGQNYAPPANGTESSSKTSNIWRRLWEHLVLLPKTEPEKAITENYSWPLLWRCFVHFVSILPSIPLIVLNIKGHFIGNSFQGPTSVSASVHVFFLQVAAKLMELLIVASLGIIVLDIINYEALFGDDGIPFGLVGSASGFKSVSFLWSTNLWYGAGAIPTLSKKAGLLIVLIIPCLIATVAGPSSALLMIPTTRDFPGGGSDFWLIGSEASLWPSTLNISAVGGEFCLNATPETIQLKTANYSSCIWSSTSAITEAAKSWRMKQLANTLTVVDGSYRREVSFRASSWTDHYYDTWAVSSGYALAASSTALSWLWYDALYHAPIARGEVSVPARLRSRNQERSVAKVSTQLPIVRVRCKNSVDLMFGTRTQLPFPLFTYYGNSRNKTGPHYDMEVPHVNSSSILTQWIPLPQSPLKNSDPRVSYPSTFLTIQLPQNAINATVYSCAVDARWVGGDAKLSNVAQDSPLQAAVVTSKFVPDKYRLPRYIPIDDEKWKQVNIDLDWLYALTPLFNNSASSSPPQTRDQPGRTSLSTLLAAAGFDDSTSLNRDEGWHEATANLESIIAILVAEGMARVGLTENFLDNSLYERARTDNAINPLYDSILRDDSEHIYNPLYLDASNGTKAHWSVSVTGYAYKADDAAYYLAIAVLLIHAAMALSHIAHGLFKGRILDAWGSFEELIALSYNSKPNHEAMRNTSTGIESGVTFTRKVKIKVMERDKSGEEQVQLLIDPDIVEFKEEYKDVKPGSEYRFVE